MDFTTDRSKYWALQIVCWSLAALYWILDAYSSNFIVSLGIWDFVFDVVIGIAVTHLYKLLAEKWNWPDLELGQLYYRIIAATIVFAALYAFLILVKLFVLRALIIDGFEVSFVDFVGRTGKVVLVTGTRILAIWVLAFHLYHYARRESKHAEQKAKLEVLLQEAQIAQLTAQINPHFLFNALNSVKSLVLTDPKNARRSIDLLSDLMRNALDINKTLEVPLAQELDIVKDYLELEKIRMGDRLEYAIHTNVTSENITIIPFGIQVLVENAIKHGISKSIKGGKIIIDIQQKVQALEIEVKNTGSIKTSSEYQGVGLSNLKERLRVQYGGQASFVLSEEKGMVCAKISIS